MAAFFLFVWEIGREEGKNGRYSRNYISLTDHLKQPNIAIWVQARGDAQEGSDWDILFILDKKKVEQNDHDNIAFPFTMLG